MTTGRSSAWLSTRTFIWPPKRLQTNCQRYSRLASRPSALSSYSSRSMTWASACLSPAPHRWILTHTSIFHSFECLNSSDQCEQAFYHIKYCLLLVFHPWVGMIDVKCLLLFSTVHQANHSIDFDNGSALVLTIESTLITACSSESLVSKGHFKNFCIRFAEGFETTWDDWKPEIRGDLVMNACE